jgi:hypothetical protein
MSKTSSSRVTGSVETAHGRVHCHTWAGSALEVSRCRGVELPRYFGCGRASSERSIAAVDSELYYSHPRNLATTRRPVRLRPAMPYLCDRSDLVPDPYRPNVR